MLIINDFTQLKLFYTTETILHNPDCKDCIIFQVWILVAFITKMLNFNRLFLILTCYKAIITAIGKSWQNSPASPIIKWIHSKYIILEPWNVRWKIQEVHSVLIIVFSWWFIFYPYFTNIIALLWSGCTPPKNCSSLKNHFSTPNHRTDMNFFVYDPNSSKNNWEFFQVFFIIKNWQKKYKNLVSVVWY